MGYPSYFEDIREIQDAHSRLASDLEAVSDDLSAGRADPAVLERKIRSIKDAIYATNCAMAKSEAGLRVCLELATDPMIDLAARYSSLDAEARDLRNSNNGLENECMELRDQLNKLNIELAELRETNEKMSIECRRINEQNKIIASLEAELGRTRATLEDERFARKNPDKFYASYKGNTSAQRP